MKYFFGIDVTENENNDTYDGEAYAAARVDGELAGRIEEAAELAQKADELCRVSPAPRKMGQTCLIFAVVWGLLAVFGLIKDPSSISSTAMIVTFAMVAVSAAAGVLLTRRAAKQAKRTPAQEAAVKTANDAFAEVTADSAKQLGVPADCPDTDLLYTVYSTKTGKAEPYSVMGTRVFTNYPRKVFAKDGDLCISDIRTLYRVPLSALGEIETVDEKIGLSFWNKEKHYRSPEYAQYDIRATRWMLSMRSYIKLTASMNGEDYLLLFPAYEKGSLEKILGR